MMRLNDADLINIVLENNSIEYIKEDIDLLTSRYDISYGDTLGMYNHIQLENMSIRYGRCTANTPLRLDFDETTEGVEMHFTLAGSSETYIDEIHQSYSIKGGEHSIFYAHDFKGYLNINDKQLDIFEVHITQDLLNKYLPESAIFDRFYGAIQKKRLAYFDGRSFPMTPQMYIVIHEIKTCNYLGNLKKLFLEAKVRELLLLQLMQIQEIDTIPKAVDLVNIDQMVYAKELIATHLDTPLSLSELSKAVGTNECYLKRNFKKIFGTTVFGYIKDLQMDKAKHLLADEHKSVKEVASIIGYKNPQHFSTAFKKRYGVTPSSFGG